VSEQEKKNGKNWYFGFLEENKIEFKDKYQESIFPKLNLDKENFNLVIQTKRKSTKKSIIIPKNQ
jgi:hypothetical protein